MHQFNLLRKMVTSIADWFLHPGNPYIELGKQQRPSMYATEIRRHLIENQVVDLQRLNKLCIDMWFGLLVQLVDNSSKRERTCLYNNNIVMLDWERSRKTWRFLDVCSNCDPSPDESSVIKTTRKRSYCWANLWSSVALKLTTNYVIGYFVT